MGFGKNISMLLLYIRFLVMFNGVLECYDIWNYRGKEDCCYIEFVVIYKEVLRIRSFFIGCLGLL